MSKEYFIHANVTGVTNSPDITYIGSGFVSLGTPYAHTVLVTPHLARPRPLICSKVGQKGQALSSSANTRRDWKGPKQDCLPSSPRGIRVTPLLAGNGRERDLEQAGNTKYPCPNGNRFRPENKQIIGNSADKGPKTPIAAPSMAHEVQTVTKAEKGGYEYAGLL